MTRNAQDIIDDMRNIVKPRIAKMLLEANFEGCGKEDKAEFETEFEVLLTLAERSATVEPQEWISVKDGLPKRGGIYYVTIQDKNGYRYVTKDRFYYDHKYFKHINYYKCLDSEIIAWQPITEPSPYKGDVEEE